MKTVTLSRRQLYEQVWSTPMRTLATRYGLSDVGLAKTCTRYNIPRPPVGYWAKKEVGKAPPQAPLPPDGDADRPEIELWDGPLPVRQPEPPPEYDADIVALLDKVMAMPQIEVPESLRRPHPLVRRAQELLAQSRLDDEQMVSSWSRDEAVVEVRVTKSNVRRALLFLDTLFKAVEALGGSVTVKKGREWQPTTTSVQLAGYSVDGMRLRERYKQVKRQPDPKDRWSYRTNDHVPTGRLVLDRGASSYEKPYCEDSEKTDCRIEEWINRLIIGWIHEAGRERIARRKAEVERRIREEQERIQREREAEIKRRRDELARLQKEEQQRVDQLFAEAERWHRAQKVRTYLAGIEQRMAASSSVPPKLIDWLRWAHEQADRLDPTVKSPPSILDKSLEEA